MKKVYCKDCRFFLSGYRCGKDIKVIDTWYQPEKEYDNPSEKNKNNNCKDYEPK